MSPPRPADRRRLSLPHARLVSSLLVCGMCLLATRPLPAQGTPAVPSVDPPVAVGTPIFAKNGAAAIRINEKIVGTARELSYPVRVRQVNGEWLYVLIATKKTGGWISRKDVLTAEQAVPYFSQVLKANAREEGAYYLRSLAYQQLGDMKKALEDMHQLVRLNPKASSLVARGALLSSQGEFAQAIRDFDEAIRQSPKEAGLYVNRGGAWQGLGDLAKALADFNMALTLDPKLAAGYYNRGNAHRELGELDKAIADYDFVLSADPKYAAAYTNRGNTWQDKGDLVKAIADYDAVIRLAPKEPSLYVNRGSALAEQGEFTKAIADFREAIRLDARFALAYNNLAWLRATAIDDKARDGKEAITMATKACELSEHSAGALDTLAAAFAESGDFAKAVSWSEKAVSKADEADQEEFKARLELYRQKKPYREQRETK